MAGPLPSLLLLLGGLALLLPPLLERAMLARRVDRRLRAAATAWQPARPGGAAPRRFRLLTALGRLLLPSAEAQAAAGQEMRLAGLPGEAALPFAGGRLLAAVLVGIAVWWLRPFDPDGGVSTAHGALAAIAVAIGLSRLLASRARNRGIRLRAGLPASIDMLTVALEGGAGIEQALRFSAEQRAHPSPVFQRAVQAAVADLDRGVPHAEMLSRLGERLAAEEALALVGVLRQSLNHGTEVVPPLRALGNDLSERRLADARAAVGRATVKMTVVMIGCFLPVLLTLIAAPALSDITAMFQGMNR